MNKRETGSLAWRGKSLWWVHLLVYTTCRLFDHIEDGDLSLIGRRTSPLPFSKTHGITGGCFFSSSHFPPKCFTLFAFVRAWWKVTPGSFHLSLFFPPLPRLLPLCVYLKYTRRAPARLVGEPRNESIKVRIKREREKDEVRMIHEKKNGTDTFLPLPRSRSATPTPGALPHRTACATECGVSRFHRSFLVRARDKGKCETNKKEKETLSREWQPPKRYEMRFFCCFYFLFVFVFLTFFGAACGNT